MISIASCRICSLDPDIRRAIDLDLASGMSYRAIGRKFSKQINRAKPYLYVSDHAKCGNVGKTPGGPTKADPETITARKEAAHKATVEDRINEVYERCKILSELAQEKAETSRDYQAAANCLDPGIKALGLLKPEEKADVNQTTVVNNYDNLSVEEIRELVRLHEKCEGVAEDPGKKKPD